MPMYRILVVEDDPAIIEAIRQAGRVWELDVRGTESFRDVMPTFTAFDPHLVLLDITLPFFNGYHWCSQIRQRSNVPIIFLSSAADNMNIVMAMTMGADDFIPKPFDLQVLLAKIQALLRRSYHLTFAAPTLTRGEAVLDTGDHTLTYRGRRVELSKNEYRILLALMERPGQVVSREKLMQRLWDTDSFVDENTLTVNINRLRRRLSAAGLQDFILTRVGEGYLVE